MLQLAAKPSPPGGRRVSQAEVERRQGAVAKLMAEGKTRREMVALTGLPARTLDAYTQRVREDWQAQARSNSQDARGRALDRLLALRERLLAANAWGPLVSLERLIADVEGVRGGGTPVEHVNPPPRIAFPALSDEEMRERIPLFVRACLRLAERACDDDLDRSLRSVLVEGTAQLEQRQAPAGDG